QGQRDAVAGADLPVSLGAGAVHGDLAPLARVLRAGAGREKARDVEPDVEADRRERGAFPLSAFHRMSESAAGGRAGETPVSEMSVPSATLSESPLSEAPFSNSPFPGDPLPARAPTGAPLPESPAAWAASAAARRADSQSRNSGEP